MTKAFGLLWEQFNAVLQAQIKGNVEWADSMDDHNTMWLLENLKKAVSGINPKANTKMALVKAISSLVNTKQGTTEFDDKLLELFISSVNTVELAGGNTIFSQRI